MRIWCAVSWVLGGERKSRVYLRAFCERERFFFSDDEGFVYEHAAARDHGFLFVERVKDCFGACFAYFVDDGEDEFFDVIGLFVAKEVGE